jgi:aconitate hydratase
MGVLPLQFRDGESAQSFGLTGEEVFEVIGLAEGVRSAFSGRKDLRVIARASDGRAIEFDVSVRIDTPQELRYYIHGGILRYVLRQLLLGKDRLEPSRNLGGSGQDDTHRQPRSDLVEEASIQSFPASDSPAY